MRSSLFRSRFVLGSICATMMCTAGLNGAIASGAEGASAQAPSSSLDKKLASTKDQLAAASLAVTRANAAVDAATAQMPAAQAKVDAALAASAAAERQQEVAKAAVAAAQAAVAAQKHQVDLQQAEIDKLALQVAGLARQSYIGGGENQELEILLQSQNPSQFATQMQAVRRTSHANSVAYDQMTAAKLVLTEKLSELQRLKDLASQQQSVADSKAQDAENAKNSAAAAEQSVRDLIASRQSSLAAAAANKSQIAAAYRKLLAEQRRIAGVSVNIGTQRNAQQAVKWAMDEIGAGGYSNLCLKFVDDAYNPTGSRVGTAIGQWYRAKEHGYGHPKDRNPPIGAQIFYWTGNPARHIAIYVGDGLAVSTDADNGRVGLIKMTELDGWGDYVGWASAYYG